MKKTWLIFLVFVFSVTTGMTGLAWAQVIKEGPIQVPLIQPKKVFVTSQTYSGNLGGLAGADAKCQQLANAAGLTGTFKAWLSDQSGNCPATRFAIGFSPPGPYHPKPATTPTIQHPYVLVNGKTIANGWADLTKGSIATPIQVDERGGTPSSYSCPNPPCKIFVWTSTTGAGRPATRPQDPRCQGGGFCGYPTNWTLEEAPQGAMECPGTYRCDCGSVGNASVSQDSRWTQEITQAGNYAWWPCSATLRLYCFQQ
jgi:hypothetical protein